MNAADADDQTKSNERCRFKSLFKTTPNSLIAQSTQQTPSPTCTHWLSMNYLHLTKCFSYFSPMFSSYLSRIKEAAATDGRPEAPARFQEKTTSRRGA